MPYEVLARKWRPQQFADVVGQEHVTQTLTNAIETERIAHAYLFVGPRGVGKTSVARIFAKALNCSKGPTATPCGVCDSCREIAAGTNFDVLEIDGASNNGVDQVRDLRDTVKYAPAHAKHKIFIIDEVHMLSTPAFNALLKTLEEPPPYVKFLLATTEPQKILATILSRCQRFDLRRIPVNLIVERLRQVAVDEKVKVEPDALLAIARGAEGGLRDAESALDQLISFRGREIKEEDVLAVFGLVSRGVLEEMTEAVLKGDVKRLMEQVARLEKAGKDLQRLVVELMEHFRNLLVCVNVDKPGGILDLTETQLVALKTQAGLTNSERLLRLMSILTDAEDRMRNTLCRRTLLETALIRCAHASVVISLEEILAQINALKAQTAGGGVAAARPAAIPSGGQKSRAAEEEPEGATLATDVAAVAEKAPAYGARGEGMASGDEVGKLSGMWPDILARVGKAAIAAKNALVDARPLRVTEESVVLGLDREFPDEAKGLKVPNNRKAVEHVLGAVLGRGIRVEIELIDSDSVRAAPAVGGESAAPVESAAGGKPAAPQGKRRSGREWAQEPAVRKALDMFSGTVVDVRE